LVVTILISLDGYVAGPGGDVTAMPLDESFSAYNLERLRTADTLLLGRNTYLGFRSYWPAVADDPAQPDTEREISRRNTAARKVVVSDSLSPDDLAGWGEAELVRRADAHDAVRRLKAQEGADILVFGSVPLYNDLLAAGLVDELHVMIGNGVLGDGVPAFTAGLPERLHLQQTRRLEGSDTVLLTYTASPAGGAEHPGIRHLENEHARHPSRRVRGR
jgi:dihydrofolate reductase